MRVKTSRPDGEKVYREESVKLPALIALVVLGVIAGPLVYWIFQINAAGEVASNTTHFNELVSAVNRDVRRVDTLFRNDAASLAAIDLSREEIMVMLEVPEAVEIEPEPMAPAAPLSITLSGIYWNPESPLAGIDNETYGVGEVVKGYEIVRIEKTTVRFRASDGTIVEKDLYEDLLRNVNE